MSVSSGNSSVESSGAEGGTSKVGTLIKHFDDTETSESYTSRNGREYTTVKDRTITVNTTEIHSSPVGNQRVPSRWWDVQDPISNSVHITSNPVHRELSDNTKSNSCSGLLPDVGILRINFPDSVAWLHPKTGGVTAAVLAGVLNAISEDSTGNNLLKSMQWTLTASPKLIPALGPPPEKFARLSNGTTSTQTSQHNVTQCYSTTLPPALGADCSPSDEDDPMHHHVTIQCETVLVELWCTQNNGNDEFGEDKTEQLKHIQKQVTTHVLEELLFRDPVYRVFVVTSQMASF